MSVASPLRAIESDLFRDAGDERFRILVIQGGKVLADWNNHEDATERIYTASIAKSIYASALGIALDEGRIRSIDDRVVDYFPAMMDVGPTEGPKPERFAREKDRSITFRHAITHFSGYLKPDERPGGRFHYQTFAMNLLAHTIAHTYGHYEPDPPKHSATDGLGTLVERWIRDEIGAGWYWTYGNFAQNRETAKIGIFGNSMDVYANTRDLGRLGWLWRTGGNWFGRQVLPVGWIEECTRPSSLLRDGHPESDWTYGQGFWVNHAGLLWEQLPENSFAAWGRGGHNVWVSREHDLVVVTSPLPGGADPDDSARTLDSSIVPRIVDALA